MIRTPALLSVLLLALPLAHAERADTFKPTEIKSRDGGTSLVTKVTTLNGSVEIRRGTLLLKADHAVITEDAQGYQHIVLTTAPNGQPVFFRQKRDGGDLWIEGQALRVDYDGDSEVVVLSKQAKVRRTSDGEETEHVDGERITYQSRAESYLVSQLPDADGASGAATVSNSGSATADRRGTIVLQPGRRDALRTPAASSAAVIEP